MYLIGIKPDLTALPTEPAPFQVGTIAFNVDPAVPGTGGLGGGSKGYIFVKDSGAGITGDGYAVVVGSNGLAVLSTTANTAAGTGQGKTIGIARAAIPANGYGWVQIFGPGTVRVLTLAAAYTQLNTTATPGVLDDDATAGARVATGIIIDTAAGGATGNVSGYLNWSFAGRTL